MRVGTGYDVHRLVTGRKLIIGGVEIPFEKGLAGHSDADVLTHAIIDALLGAAGLGDIGLHFPDTSADYKDIDSMILLKHALKNIVKSGYQIGNIDATVVCQRPKLRGYIDQMIKTLATALQIKTSQINIKATTTERLGFEGEGLGVSAQAVALLVERKSANR